jgi:cell division protein FtsW
MSRDSAILLVLVLALLAVGLVMLYSATAVVAEKSPRYQDAGHFLKKQLVWTLVGAAAMLAVSRVPHGAWARWRVPILAATVVLLGLVFVPGLGATLNAARRWVRVGGFFFQPSEFAKIGIAVFIAGFAAQDPERLRRFFKGLVPAGAALATVCGLILVEPDVGTSLFIAMVMGMTMIVAGVRWLHVTPLVVGAGGLIAYFALARTEHVAARLDAWLHPEHDPLGKGHQILQSLLALGAGGWTGEGLGRGTAKLYFLPEAHCDFILPVIGEEMGFAGTSAVILLYLALGLVGYRIMRRAPDRFGFLLSFALTTYIILQAAINVAVVTASMPTKGIPLPFISAGGSSVILTMVGVGMLVSIGNAAERGECQETGATGSSSPAAAAAAMSFPASPSPNTP